MEMIRSFFKDYVAWLTMPSINIIAIISLCSLVAIIIIAIINSANSSDEITKPENIGSELTKYAERFFPLMLIVLLSMFILLFVSMYLLYKRREK